MKRFKKIYIEITNKCNLNCSFCSKDNVLLREMTLEEFEHILKQIDDQTDYVYLHVKGEPLLHSHFKEILELCSKYHKKVNLTTNGTLLSKRVDDIITTNIVRQINISLQSIIDDSYLLTILTSVSKILDDTNIFVVYRFWTLNNNKFNVLQNNIYNKLLSYH
ncbi:MAG: radical SAM protein, partial [Bacilli bacterium]